MSVFNDSAGNWYLGDCRWNNNDVLYPATYYLNTDVGSSVTSVTNLFSLINSFLSNFSSSRETLSSNYGVTGTCSSTNWYPIFRWNPTNDVRTAGNWAFEIMHNGMNAGCGIGRFMISRYRNTSGVFFDSGGGSPTTSGWLALQNCCMCADANGESLSLFGYSLNTNRTMQRYVFLHAGLLSNPNTNIGGLYSNNKINHAFLGYFPSESTPSYNHYRVSGKSVLLSGDAVYPISCTNGTIPNSQWATNLLVFEDNNAIGNPAIGVVKNLLISTATGLTIGKPVYIDGSAVSDGGSRWFIPVGTFAGRTMLMRCYSSVVVS